jgi:signal transduction histidine kinase/ActR/RegA family two-component response regulator
MQFCLYILILLVGVGSAWGQGSVPVDLAELDALLEQGDAMRRSDPHGTAIIAERAIAMAEQLDDDARSALAYKLLGNVHATLGDLDAAEDAQRQYLSLCVEMADKECEAKACNNLGNTMRRVGNFAESIALHQRAITIKRELNYPSLPNSLMNLAIVYEVRGNYEDGLALMLEAEELGQRDEYTWPNNLYHNLATLYAELERFDESLRYSKLGLDEAVSLGHKASTAYAHQNVGGNYQALGDMPRAYEHLQKALALREEIGNPGTLSLSYRGLANYHLELGELEQAAIFAERAVELAREAGMQPAEARALEGAHQARWGLGESALAYEHLLAYHQLEVELRGQEATRELGRVEAEAEHERALLVIEQQRRDEQARQAQRQRRLVLLLLGSALVGLLSLFYLRSLRRRNALIDAERKRAQSASEAKGRFLASMSHELRTPLNAVMGHAQLLDRRGTLDDEERRMVSTIYDSGAHLLSLINDVLDMAKVEAGRTTLELEDFDLRRAMGSVREMVAGRAAEKGLQLVFEGGDSLPLYVHGDARRLRQVLLNLLSNALKFTKQGAVTVELEHRADQLHVAVADTGIGIAPEEQQRLFQAFQQSESGRRSGVGTGLGLALSRELVRLMGGEMSLESEPGVGTTVRFHVKAPEVATRERGPQGAGAVVGLAEGQSAPDVMVVEDSEVNRRLLCQLLRELGCQVREAEDGQQALDAVAEHPPAIIWMDAKMPVMDGLEATRRVLAEHPEVVVLALSASISDVEREEFLAAGARAFLRKPYQEAEIFEAMQRHAGVRFAWSDAEPSPDQAGALVRGALRGLAPELRDRLKDAAVTGDADGIRAIVDALRPAHPELARSLDGALEQYAYEAILEALESGQV